MKVVLGEQWKVKQRQNYLDGVARRPHLHSGTLHRSVQVPHILLPGHPIGSQDLDPNSDPEEIREREGRDGTLSIDVFDILPKLIDVDASEIEQTSLPSAVDSTLISANTAKEPKMETDHGQYNITVNSSSSAGPFPAT